MGNQKPKRFRPIAVHLLEVMVRLLLTSKEVIVIGIENVYHSLDTMSVQLKDDGQIWVVEGKHRPLHKCITSFLVEIMQADVVKIGQVYYFPEKGGAK